MKMVWVTHCTVWSLTRLVHCQRLVYFLFGFVLFLPIWLFWKELFHFKIFSYLISNHRVLEEAS